MTAAALQDRVAALVAQAKSQAESNRAKAPEFAAFVDDFRRVFGGDVRVRYVKWPDGSSQGKPFAEAAPKPAAPTSERPRARRADPGTSKAAAAVASVLAADHHERILAALDTPSTAYDIAARCGMGQVAVARRMGELRDAGRVVDTGRTAPGPTGRQCTVWERV